MVGRVLVSVIAIPLLLGITILGEYWFAICVAGIGVLALYEVYRIIDLWGINTYRLLGLLALLGVLGNAYWNFSTYITIMVVFAFTITVWHSILTVSRGCRTNTSDVVSTDAGHKRISSLLFTTLGLVYIAWPLSLAISIREWHDGVYWILLVMLGTFATDTASFLVGKTFGRHKLAPSISPNKTVEGAVGGVILGAIAILTLIDVFSLDFISFQVEIIFAILFTISAQIGDLLESTMKRRALIKDAGSIIPGHGGVLDRLDSVILVLLFVYYSRLWVIN